jgi:hypothetical protein
VILITSCGATKVQVGNYNNIDCKTTLYKKSKDIYLFWDIVPIKRTEKKIKVKDYEKVVRRDFFDNVIFYGTAGIFSFYSVKINTKKCDDK